MTDLLNFGNILYISSVDISVGDGPGVNEREFILALYGTIKERSHFLIPEPLERLPDLPTSVYSLSSSHQHHSPRRYLAHSMSTIRLADRILSKRQFDLLVFRLDLLPIAPLTITRKHAIPFALKTLGQGQMKVIAERIKWPLGQALGRVNQWLVKQMVKNAIAADTVSNWQQEYLQRTIKAEPGKIVNIDNAVNTHRFFSDFLNRGQGRGRTGALRSINRLHWQSRRSRKRWNSTD